MVFALKIREIFQLVSCLIQTCILPYIYIFMIQYDLNLWSINIIQVNGTPFSISTIMICVLSMSQIGLEGEKIWSGEDFFHILVILLWPLTLELEIWFKITVHPLPKGTLWVKYEPGGEKIYLGQDRLEMDRITDGQTYRLNT